MMPLRVVNRLTHPTRMTGPIIEAPLNRAFIGEVCEIRRHWRDTDAVARAQVIGFRQDAAVLSLLGSAAGCSRESVLVPTGRPLTVRLGDDLLGAVVDSTGRIVGRIADARPERAADTWAALEAPPPSIDNRLPIRTRFLTGVRAIDGLMTCGIGQRVGIFAEAGTGKTTLSKMLIDHASADVSVIGLIGERGREVTELVEELSTFARRERTVIVFSTSDAPAVDRCNAALLATTVAEYFRDRGMNVLLLQDSLTRYARALRDVALAAGEAPARRGYPASVFEALPRLLERPGATASGSITAFYTVLLESDEEADPMAEEIRSILDGHLHLSRRLASANHYPAIDVRRSLSRVASQICDAKHVHAAGRIRTKMARMDDLQMLVDLGEYRRGESADDDALLALRPQLDAWLRQRHDERCEEAEMLRGLHVLAG
ncbi:type III secretion system ATPase SctN [Burkholderia dolosa]|uniref:Type III secretion system ATPase SctN n=2 Tax=Burkholderia TaxID=32008 RepID=A0A892IFW0_9BURK|nr:MULTISPECIES: type III secretion system ATPase SctN [Burkholderia]AKE05322.1 ATP synthase [Burkholderia cepacia]PUA76164.1 FliI/YscN family ATPase [Burkholderia sp. AU29985]AJY10076.1 putative ATP synthase SpaL [Burkholderia dolosa AU0158]AYZ94363.1 FliI/YscN family ATPase [Burkholderia dolosa]ETP63597.1 ATP synthase SpaL [Burkholderia dolosa PC543]